jgi:hypothetical protein
LQQVATDRKDMFRVYAAILAYICIISVRGCYLDWDL